MKGIFGDKFYTGLKYGRAKLGYRKVPIKISNSQYSYNKGQGIVSDGAAAVMVFIKSLIE